jgi:hypothetical protein
MARKLAVHLYWMWHQGWDLVAELWYVGQLAELSPDGVSERKA